MENINGNEINPVEDLNQLIQVSKLEIKEINFEIPAFWFDFFKKKLDEIEDLFNKTEGYLNKSEEERTRAHLRELQEDVKKAEQEYTGKELIPENTKEDFIARLNILG